MDLYLIEMCPSRAVAIIYIANKKYAAERIVNGAIHRKSIRISEYVREVEEPTMLMDQGLGV
jgi:hypothetical protein